MASSSPEDYPAYFGFTHLHRLKNSLVAATVDAPDDFIEMDWLKPEDQMNRDRALIVLQPLGGAGARSVQRVA